MNFVADESIDQQIVQRLREEGYSLGKKRMGTLVQIQLDIKKGRSSMRAYAETSETRCPGDIASCDGTGDRRNPHIQDG